MSIYVVSKQICICVKRCIYDLYMYICMYVYNISLLLLLLLLLGRGLLPAPEDKFFFAPFSVCSLIPDPNPYTLRFYYCKALFKRPWIWSNAVVHSAQVSANGSLIKPHASVTSPTIARVSRSFRIREDVEDEDDDDESDSASLVASWDSWESEPASWIASWASWWVASWASWWLWESSDTGWASIFVSWIAKTACLSCKAGRGDGEGVSVRARFCSALRSRWRSFSWAWTIHCQPKNCPGRPWFWEVGCCSYQSHPECLAFLVVLVHFEGSPGYWKDESLDGVHVLGQLAESNNQRRQWQWPEQLAFSLPQPCPARPKF